jgi:hypothetical protein
MEQFTISSRLSNGMVIVQRISSMPLIPNNVTLKVGHYIPHGNTSDRIRSVQVRFNINRTLQYWVPGLY